LADFERVRDVRAEIINENSFEDFILLRLRWEVFSCFDEGKLCLLEKIKYPSANEMSALSWENIK
jgi:hypothetical protein